MDVYERRSRDEIQRARGSSEGAANCRMVSTAREKHPPAANGVTSLTDASNHIAQWTTQVVPPLM